MTAFNGNDMYVNDRLDDVSTAGQIYIPVPEGGRLKKVITRLNGAIATADAVLTVKVDGTSVGTITIANASSAAGDADILENIDANVDVNGAIEIETNGASTNAVSVGISCLLRR